MDRRQFVKQAALIGAGAMIPAAAVAAGPTTRALGRALYGRKVFGLIAVGSRHVTSVRLRLSIPPEKMGLYRKLLPPQLDLPVVPRIYFYISEFQGTYPVKIEGGYREAAVLIRASFKGDKKTDPRTGGWHVLDMPVNAKSALSSGLMMGYPKYLAEIGLSVDEAGAAGEVWAGGREVFRMSWEPAAVEIPALPEEEVTVPVYVIANGKVNIMQNEVPEQGEFECRTGITTVTLAGIPPYLGLLDGSTVKGPGAVKVFSGRFNLTRRSK